MNRNKKTKILVCILIIMCIAVISAIVAIKLNSNSGNNNTTKQDDPEKPKLKILDLNSKSRPFAVMINNIGDARQVQSGLSDAYLVYEIVAEGGITRFLALFKDVDTAKIGSVRSSRHYYLDYALENDAIYVHWGWSPQAQEDIKTLKINNINGLTYEGKYFYRWNPLGLSIEHTGFTDMSKLKEAASNLKYRTETDKGVLLNYSIDSVNLDNYEDVEDATEVDVNYSNYAHNKYVYDKEAKVYKRSVNGEVQKDYAANKTITVKNIIVYSLENYSIANDPKGRQNLDNIGSGDAYFITEGKAVKITWTKTSRESKTVYKYKDGTEIKVNDGNTFIQILPLTGSLSIK